MASTWARVGGQGSRFVQSRLVGCPAELGGNRSSFKVWSHEGGTSRK